MPDDIIVRRAAPDPQFREVQPEQPATTTGSAEVTQPQPPQSTPAQVQQPISDFNAPAPQPSVAQAPPQPSPQQPTISDVQTTSQSDPAPTLPTQPELPQNQQNADQPPVEVAPKKRSTKPVGIIIVAVIVCLALAGGVIYATLQKNKSGSKKATSSQSATTQTQPATASPDDVDGAINQTNDLQDQGNSSELSDQNLGL